MQANFYKLTTAPIAKVLPKLLEQIIAQPQNNVLLVCRNGQEMQELDTLLWTFAQLSFLPHATEDDAEPQMQRILLTTSGENNLNNANVICSLNYDLPIGHFEKAIFMYEANDNAAQEKIHALHQQLSEANKTCNFFTQTEKGWQRASLSSISHLH
jgi:DNA polymerase III subunit chi